MRALFVASLALSAAIVCSSCSSEESKPPASNPFGNGGAAGSGGSAGIGNDASAGTSGESGAAGTSGGSAGSAGSGGDAGTGGSAGGGTGGGGGSLADGAACQVDPAPAASQGVCVVLYSPGYECNPVTSEGCEPGQVCEFFNDRFACFPAATTQGACGECYAQGQAYCGPGFTCYGGTNICTRFCCDDSDCAAGTTCVPQPPTTVGICQADDGTRFAGFAFAVDGGQGGSAGQDAGDDAAEDADGSVEPDGGDAAVEGWIACVDNTPAPSNGSCHNGPGCNPISQAGCDKATENCEWVGDSFACVTRFDNLGPCDLCSAFGLCAAGYTCDPSGICARFCCTDADCGGTFYCDPYDKSSPGSIGVCKSNQ